MKVSVIAIAGALLGLAAAQAPTLPTCAQPCVTKYTTGDGIAGCPSLNIGCICSNAGFLSGIACCLTGACSASDQTAAVAYAKSICATAGVTVPDAVVCTNATSTTSTSMSMSSTSTTASATKNAATGSAVGSGMGLAGGIAAILALI